MDIRHGFFGKQYALFTEKGMEAIEEIKRYEGVQLEGTYTGKAFAALIDDAAKKELGDKIVLFWNTHNSIDFSVVIKTIDYKQLPRCFHHYFVEDVQCLDRLS